MREDFIIKGISGIKKVYMNTKKIFNEDKDGRMKYLDREEYILETEGVNLKEIMTNDHVDYTRCASNDI
jgi:DNA-directed RNA polymerase II subunit RPB1